MADKVLTELADNAKIDYDGRWGNARLIEELRKGDVTIPDAVLVEVGEAPATATPPVPMPATPRPAAPMPAAPAAPAVADTPAAPVADEKPEMVVEADAPEPEAVPTPAKVEAPVAPVAPAKRDATASGVFHALLLVKSMHVDERDLGRPEGRGSKKFSIGDEIPFTNEAAAKALHAAGKVRLL